MRRIPTPGAWLAGAAGAALAAVCLAAAGAPALGPSQDLMNRASNPKFEAYEEQLTRRIDAELSRYLGRNQYVLSVKAIFNPALVPAVQNPAQAPDTQKLPGFPVYVLAPEARQADSSTPPVTRLTVQVLLDDSLPDYYERFVRQVVPIVAGFDSRRGDEVIVVKEAFPKAKEEKQPPMLPEKELMEKAQPPAPVMSGALAPTVRAGGGKLAWGAGYGRWLPVTGYLFSLSHGSRLATIRVTPLPAARTYGRNVQELRNFRPAEVKAYPAGTEIAMETWAIGADFSRAAPGPIFFMKKEPAGYDPAGNDWRYAMTQPDLSALAEGKSGPVTECRACHLKAKDRDCVYASDR